MLPRDTVGSGARSSFPRLLDDCLLVDRRRRDDLCAPIRAPDDDALYSLEVSLSERKLRGLIGQHAGARDDLACVALTLIGLDADAGTERDDGVGYDYRDMVSGRGIQERAQRAVHV